jgi:3-hydroxyacyl-CoA dehydrogenase
MQVHLYDPDLKMRELAMPSISQRIDALLAHNLLEDAPDAVLARVRIFDHLESAVIDVELVVECAPENVGIKQDLFERLDRFAPADAVLVSASSAIVVSAFASGINGRERCLIAHPGNPPYLIPVIELVPAEFTAHWALEKAGQLFGTAGLRPVRVNKEVEGFIFNRLQGAVLREAYCLVRDGVASVEDIDTVMKDGLGPRWSIIGPFETVDLNTRGGIASHAKKMGPAYERMGAERGQHDPWTAELVEVVVEQRRRLLPLEDWDKRVSWRDERLMRLTSARKLDEVDVNT